MTCPRCGGTLLKDLDGPTCINCAYVWISEREREMVKELVASAAPRDGKNRKRNWD